MIIFTDIDDTLMKTKRKIINLNDCSIGAYSEKGEALSYSEPFHHDFITNFIEKHFFIPVTARSFSALSRVQMNFKHEKIINFGSHILNSDNSIDQQWHNHIISQQKNLNIMEKKEKIKQDFILSPDIKLIERNEYDTFVFLNFRNSNLKLEDNLIFAKNLNQFLADNNMQDFYLYITDRDVTLIPSYIKKQLAVAFLLEKYHGMTSIGIGDHKNDFPFMSLCHFSLFPNDSSLSKLLKELS